VAEVVRVFELVESVVEKEGAPLPSQVATARPLLLQRPTYAAALAARRAYVADTFGEGDPMAAKMARRVEMAHALLSGFASHERRRAAKDTVRAILNAAVGGGLDACMQQLAESGTLDGDLLAYLTSLVDAEARKCGLPAPRVGGPLADEPQASDVGGGRGGDVATTESESIASGRAGSRSALLSVLEIVRRRVVAEMQHLAPRRDAPDEGPTSDAPAPSGASEGLSAGKTQMVKILAQAAAIAEDDARLRYLASVLVDRQGARSFVRFAEDGAAFLTEQAEKVAQRELFDPMGEAEGGPGGAGRGLDVAAAAKVRQAGRVRATALQARAVLAKLPVL
jgi:hypothetical protein